MSDPIASERTASRCLLAAMALTRAAEFAMDKGLTPQRRAELVKDLRELADELGRP